VSRYCEKAGLAISHECKKRNFLKNVLWKRVTPEKISKTDDNIKVDLTVESSSIVDM
jgi:hypothetical protein